MSARRTTASRTARAAAAVAALVLVLGACGQDGDEDEGAPAGSDQTSSEVAEPVTLTLPETSEARCMMVSPEVLAQMDAAFEGTVTAIEGGEVTLDVTRWFSGDEAETVAVTQQDTAVSVPVVTFEEGSTYLVSATDGVVSMCGFSGETSPELLAVYEAAFPAE